MKRKESLIVMICVVALLLGILPAKTTSAAPKVSSLKLNKTFNVMRKGERFTLKANVLPHSAKRSVWWKSSNPKVAVVDKNGTVIARRKGKATITVFQGNKRSSCQILVGTPIKKLTPDKNTISLTTGNKTKLNVNVSPKTASVKTLQYSSQNKKIATVSKGGMIKGITAGTTQITVRSTDGHNKRAHIKVRVNPGTPKKTTDPTIHLTVNPIINITLDPSTNPATGTTPPPENIQEVTGIYLSDTEKSLNINETTKLTASVTPVNAANAEISWESSDTNVVTVSDTGLVTPEGEGTAEICASAGDGKYSAKCTVTVTPTAVVSNDKEIAYALSKKHLKTLEISGDTTRKLTVPEGNYNNVDMVVTLPNGELENNGVFNSITIEKISADTFIENAIGNIIDVISKKSHVIISDKASATLIISKENHQVEIENNGTIKKMTIHSKGTVDIMGDSDKKIPVEVTAEASISTTKRLDINATDHFNITIRPGAENTEVAVDMEINMPNIFGLGVINVKVTATGGTKTVIGENNGPDVLAKTVKVTGSVYDIEGNGIEGADIYLIEYSDDYDIGNIWLDSNAIKLTTNQKGEYTSGNKIKSGNYYLAAKKENYGEVSQKIVITSAQGETYTNEEIILIPSDWNGKKGNVTGKILDSAQKDLAIPDIAVRLRKGKGSIDDTIPVEKETRTDSEGIYLFEDLDAGYYTIELDDDKTRSAGGDAYLRTWINVLIRPDETTTEGAVMSKTLLDDQLRFVLKWGAKESGAVADLDAHLRGPGGYDTDSGYRFHTCYTDKSYNNTHGQSSLNSHAELDVDDMDYDGPETTTIYESAPGIYSYYVHDYTNRYSQDSTKLSESSVKVEVYSGNLKQHTYYIPQKEGTVWHVFDYDSNTKTFKTVNTMYYETDSWYVGNTVDEYKSWTSSTLSSINAYYKALEAGTGEDILKKTETYQQRLDALTDKQEAEATKLHHETEQYLNELQNECYLRCSAEGLYDYNFTWQSDEPTLTLYTGKMDFKPTEYTFNGNNDNVTITEVATTDKNAWKACRVIAENGHTLVIPVYIEFDLNYAQINHASIGEESLTLADGNDYRNYPIRYVHSSQNASYELKDVKFTFSADAEQVLYDSHKVDGEYTVTIQSGTKEKTWIIRKQPLPQITAPDNTIYGIDVSGNIAYIYAADKALDKNCRATINGKPYALQKGKSDGIYSRYFVDAEDIYYHIFCCSIDEACSLQNVSFNHDVTPSIDQANNTVTLNANSSGFSAGDLSLSWGNTSGGNTNVTYEALTGEDYDGKITVTINGVNNYSRVYKVYFNPYTE